MPEVTESDHRFLQRVETITLTPWTGKVSAVDAKGKKLRLSKATFEKLKSDGLIIRSASSLTTDTYTAQDTKIVDATIAMEEGSS